jgi:hypothetical protein
MRQTAGESVTLCVFGRWAYAVGSAYQRVEQEDTSSSKLDKAAAAHDADAHASGTLATSSSFSSAVTRRELRPEQREQREPRSTAQAHGFTTHGRHAGHRAHGRGHGSSSSGFGSSSRRAGPPPYVRTTLHPRVRDNGGVVGVGGGVEGDEGGEEGEGALAEFKESGTRTLGTRLQVRANHKSCNFWLNFEPGAENAVRFTRRIDGHGNETVG